jgi:hypothetical protein
MLLGLVGLCLSARTFKIVGTNFEMDGKPFRIIGGVFHYFRKNPGYWEDSMKKMLNMGLNVLQSFVCWQLHEPEEGQYYFEGQADLPAFLSLAARYNLYVMLRCGPYMAGEVDFGGFPFWLLNYIGPEQFRTYDLTYLKYVDIWLNKLLNIVRPFMYYNGGPIITCQVENEYGHYNHCNVPYMEHLEQLFRSILGQEAVLTTVDNANSKKLKCGNPIPHKLFATVDFMLGADYRQKFWVQRKFNNGTGPNINVEYWTSWYDYWGGNHSTSSAELYADQLDKMLEMGGNVNLYC